MTSLSVLVHVLPLRSRKLRWQHNQYPIQSPRQFLLDTYAVMQFTIHHDSNFRICMILQHPAVFGGKKLLLGMKVERYKQNQSSRTRVGIRSSATATCCHSCAEPCSRGALGSTWYWGSLCRIGPAQDVVDPAVSIIFHWTETSWNSLSHLITVGSCLLSSWVGLHFNLPLGFAIT